MEYRIEPMTPKLRLWAVCALLAPAVACTGNDGPSVGGSAGTADDADTGEEDDGTTGGTEEPEVFVFVPEGAFDGEFEPTIEVVDSSIFPTPETLASPIYELGPDGTQFSQPVTVGVPIDPDTPADTLLEMVTLDPDSQQWVPLDGATIIGGTLVAKTDHFSPYGVNQNPNATGCDILWSGGPGKVVPLLTPNTIVVSGGVRQNQDIAWSGPSQMELGSTWVVDGCSADVTGAFGAGLDGPGRYIDYSQGGTNDIANDGGGAFSFTLNASQGPFFGLTDPCNAAHNGWLYSLNVHFTGQNCSNPCDGVMCNNDDGNPCTMDTCNMGTGMCEQQPVVGACGNQGGGICVNGGCMVEVPMNQGVSGDSLCAAEGLTCAEVPVMSPPESACQAFHPGATVSTDANGWQQGIYCDNNMGAACSGRINDCHDCPACNSDGLACGTSNSDLIEAIYARCQ